MPHSDAIAIRARARVYRQSSVARGDGDGGGQSIGSQNDQHTEIRLPPASGQIEIDEQLPCARSLKNDKRREMKSRARAEVMAAHLATHTNLQKLSKQPDDKHKVKNQ